MKKLALLAILGLTACGSVATPSAPAESKPSGAASASSAPSGAVVRVQGTDAQNTSQNPVYIAMDRGYFSAEGLNVEIAPLNDPAAGMQSIATNQLQFAVSVPDPVLFNAVTRNIDLKILASSTVNSPDDRPAVLMVRQDLVDSGAYKSPADLKGRNVSVPATSSEFYVDRFMQQAGLTIDEVKVVSIRTPDTLAAFSNKAVDAGWVTEPTATTLVAQKTAKIVGATGQLFPGAVAAVLIMSPQFTTAQPKATQGFVNAYVRGLRDYWHAFNKKDVDRGAVVTVLINHTVIKDPKLYDQIGLPSVNPNGDTNPTDSWNVYQDFFVKRGLVPKRADLAQLVDFSFVNRRYSSWDGSANVLPALRRLARRRRRRCLRWRRRLHR